MEKPTREALLRMLGSPVVGDFENWLDANKDDMVLACTQVSAPHVATLLGFNVVAVRVWAKDRKLAIRREGIDADPDMAGLLRAREQSRIALRKALETGNGVRAVGHIPPDPTAPRARVTRKKGDKGVWQKSDKTKSRFLDPAKYPLLTQLIRSLHEMMEGKIPWDAARLDRMEENLGLLEPIAADTVDGI